jgi:hypothetical protein
MIRNFTSVTKIYSEEGENFLSYEVVENSITKIVPLDEANTDYIAIQEWVAIEGNEIIDNGGSE